MIDLIFSIIPNAFQKRLKKKECKARKFVAKAEYKSQGLRTLLNWNQTSKLSP